MVMNLTRTKRIMSALAVFIILGASSWALWQKLAEEHKPSTTAKPAAKSPNIPPEALAMLAGGGTLFPETEEDRAERSQWESQQLALARQRLNSPDVEVRFTGVEQLSAYNNSEAEKLLTGVLTDEQETSVQIAAANSLAYFKTVSESTLDALQNAITSPNEQVAYAALFALEAYVAHEPYGSERATAILGKLKHISTSSLASKELSESVANYLSEQAPPE